MTPTASRLRERLEERRRWFTNEWFFKWHFIGKDEPVTIDSFDARGIHYGGIAFSGTARLAYWDAITRGVRKEITEQFAWVDSEVRRYNPETAMRAIDECAGQLISFVRVVRREAVVKDRILRGDGVSFPREEDAGQWHGTGENDILRQAEALKAALPLLVQQASVAPAIQLTLSRRASALWHDNQWWLGPIALVVGLAGVIPLFF